MTTIMEICENCFKKYYRFALTIGWVFPLPEKDCPICGKPIGAYVSIPWNEGDKLPVEV